MPVLNSLHINLHQEEEVDFLLRNLPVLQMLNGLVVERDAIFSEEEDNEGEASAHHGDSTVVRSSLEIKVEPDGTGLTKSELAIDTYEDVNHVQSMTDTMPNTDLIVSPEQTHHK